MPTTVKTEMFKGRFPTLVLDAGAVLPRRSFKFGVVKAKLILEHYEAIKTFVEKYGADAGEEPEHTEPELTPEQKAKLGTYK